MSAPTPPPTPCARAASTCWSSRSGCAAAADDESTRWARESYAAIERFLGPNRYLNYLDDDDVGDAALAAAYGPNLRRLRAVKAQYDPDNAFHLNVNIPPAS